MIYRKSPEEIGLIREACRVVAGALDAVEELMTPGVTTAEIDTTIERFIRDSGGVPAFLGYQGYPASTCISINDEVVHGIPSPRRHLKDGDVVGLDVGVKLNGYFGDSARTFAVGTVSPAAVRLLRVTEEALALGIEAARPGNRVGDISEAVQVHAEGAGFSVVRTLVGHGVGKQLHEEPAVPNFGRSGVGPRLETGMVLAIEPMINLGGKDVRTLADGWTIVTSDGSLSAHFEHTVAILESGPEILSLPASGEERTAEGRG